MAKKKRGPKKRAVKGWCFAKPYNFERCKGHTTLEKHHRKSRARGGSDAPGNIDYLCWVCHGDVTTHRGEWTSRFRTYTWQDEGETEHAADIVSMAENPVILSPAAQRAKNLNAKEITDHIDKRMENHAYRKKD